MPELPPATPADALGVNGAPTLVLSSHHSQKVTFSDSSATSLVAFRLAAPVVPTSWSTRRVEDPKELRHPAWMGL